VLAENAVGSGTAAETGDTVEVKSPYDVPDAPRNLEATEVSGRSIVVEWAAPRNDGGAPIRGYVLERKQAFSTRFVRLARGLVGETYYKDTAVLADTDYEYRVAAENEAGVGAFSQSTGPILAREPFGNYTTSFLKHFSLKAYYTL
jgi:titin